MFGAIGQAELLLLILYLIFLVFPFWKIFEKTGFPGWYSIFMILPPLYLIGIFYLAYSKWPIHKTKEISCNRGDKNF